MNEIEELLALEKDRSIARSDMTGFLYSTKESAKFRNRVGKIHGNVKRKRKPLP